MATDHNSGSQIQSVHQIQRRWWLRVNTWSQGCFAHVKIGFYSSMILTVWQIGDGCHAGKDLVVFQLLGWRLGVKLRVLRFLGGVHSRIPHGEGRCFPGIRGFLQESLEEFQWVYNRYQGAILFLISSVQTHFSVKYLKTAFFSTSMETPPIQELQSQIDSITRNMNNHSLNPLREAKTVSVTPNMRNCQSELNRLSVVVKLLDGEMSYPNLRSALFDVWYGANIQSCKELERGILQVWFRDERSFRSVVAAQPWIIAGHILQVAGWEQYRAAGRDCFRAFYVWMAMLNYPSGYIGQYRTGEAGNKIIIENLTGSGFFQKSQIKTVQIHAAEGDEELVVRVKLSMHKLMQIPPGFKVPYLVSDIWIPFAYEFLPAFCFKCGLLGHSRARCPLPDALSATLYSSRNRVFNRPEGGSLLQQHIIEMVKLIGDAGNREKEYIRWKEGVKPEINGDEGHHRDFGRAVVSSKNTHTRTQDKRELMEVTEQRGHRITSGSVIIRDTGAVVPPRQSTVASGKDKQKVINSNEAVHPIRWESLKTDGQDVVNTDNGPVVAMQNHQGSAETAKRKGTAEAVSCSSKCSGVNGNGKQQDFARKKRKMETVQQVQEMSGLAELQISVRSAREQIDGELKVVGTDLHQSPTTI